MVYELESLVLSMERNQIPLKQISEILLVTEDKVKSIIKAKVSEDQKFEIVEYWRDGLSPEEISARIGISVVQVKKSMKDLCLID